MGHDDDQQLNPPSGSDRQDFEFETQPATESVEQYVRLHEHIERLRADRRPAPPGALNEDDARTYQVAALFRAAAPGADDPDPVFMSRLLHELEGMRSSTEDAAGRGPEPAASGAPIAANAQPVPNAGMAPTQPPAPTPTPIPRRGLTRRGVLTRGLGVAAAAAVGVTGGMAVEHHMMVSGHTSATTVDLVPSGTGIWVTVARADAIPLGGVLRFTTDYIVGFVRHTPQGFMALSGVCTHMGCLLQWNPTPRTFDCPCHGGRFSEDGTSAPSSAVWYLPLPKLETRVEDGQIQVYVVPPVSPTSPTSPAAGDPTQQYGMQGRDNA